MPTRPRLLAALRVLHAARAARSSGRRSRERVRPADRASSRSGGRRGARGARWTLCRANLTRAARTRLQRRHTAAVAATRRQEHRNASFVPAHTSCVPLRSRVLSRRARSHACSRRVLSRVTICAIARAYLDLSAQVHSPSTTSERSRYAERSRYTRASARGATPRAPHVWPPCEMGARQILATERDDHPQTRSAQLDIGPEDTLSA